MIEWDNKKKVVLLAGSTGYIGKSLLAELLRKDFNVICITRGNDPEGFQKSSNKALKISYANVCNFEEIDEVSNKFGQVDLIISCLGSRHGTKEEADDVEYGANINLLNVGKKLKVRQFILLSAICVQKPVLLFQKAKLRFEKALISSDIRSTIIRPTAFFKSISGQISRIKSGKRFVVFDSGQNTRCKPISERNLSQFICTKIFNNEAYDQTFIIGGPGPAVSLKEQGELLFKLTSLTPKFFYMPSVILKIFTFIISPVAICSKKAANYQEFLKIGFFYATESMLLWDNEKKTYDDKNTPEFGQETLEEFFKKSLESDSKDILVPDKKLF